MTKNKFTHFIKENVAPKGTKEIGVYNKNGKKVGVIPLGLLAPPTSTKQYSFCAISDIHVPYTTGADDFKRALTFVENNDIDFTCICGDLTSSGSDSELEQYKSQILQFLQI